LAILAVGGASAVGMTVVPAQAASSPSLVSSSTIQSSSAADIYGDGPLLSTTTSASTQAKALAASDPADAAAAKTIASIPSAIWLGEWTEGSTLTSTLNTATAAAAASNTTAVFVTYDIPDRDCGGYSAGGTTESQYNAWVDQIASTIKGTRSVVVVEPDSLAMLSNADCSSVVDSDRYSILSREVSAFSAAGIPSYLDGGDSNWVPAATMATRLEAAGVANARGFFSNVSNYYSTAAEQAYDEKIAADLGGNVHYIIDTSRSGQGWKGTWCNAPGAGLGATPRIVGDSTGLDALLYVKTPGESDGECNDGPAAGDWYASYATALVKNAVFDEPTGTPSATPTGTPSATPTGTPTATPSATADGAPKGSLAAASTVTAGISVSGWAFDPAATSKSLAVTITEDGTKVATTTANVTSSSAARAAGAGTKQGYSAIVRGAAGKRTICVTATNASGAHSTSLGCRTVTVPAAGPVGRLDAASSSAKRRVTMSGWTFDRDSIAKALTVQITSNGRVLTTTTASKARADVNNAYGAGASHGYSVTFAIASGARKLCAVAVNVGSGTNTSLGCKTVAVR
jgi:cellulase/cellobiase CelA1